MNLQKIIATYKITGLGSNFQVKKGNNSIKNGLNKMMYRYVSPFGNKQEEGGIIKSFLLSMHFIIKW